MCVGWKLFTAKPIFILACSWRRLKTSSAKFANLNPPPFESLTARTCVYSERVLATFLRRPSTTSTPRLGARGGGGVSIPLRSRIAFSVFVARIVRVRAARRGSLLNINIIIIIVIIIIVVVTVFVLSSSADRPANVEPLEPDGRLRQRL